MATVLRSIRTVWGVIRRVRQLLLRGAEFKENVLNRRPHKEVKRACAVKE